MEISNVSIIGLGALGILFGNQMRTNMPGESIRIIADQGRIKRYKKDGIYCNGALCDFEYERPEEKVKPADLIIFAVKYNDLKEAIWAVRNQVGPETVIISLLNGITSEQIIADAYGKGNVLDCVAQGMDAVKEGNRLRYSNMGMICFGMRQGRGTKENMKRAERFFEKTNVPFEVVQDMDKRMWGKLMVNVGVNQTVAVCGSCYGDIQKEGWARDTMIAAMEEVRALSKKEKAALSKEDLIYWLKIVDGLDPNKKPSMRQDVEAERASEVELFAGTVIALGEKHNILTPVNRWLYDEIIKIESQY